MKNFGKGINLIKYQTLFEHTASKTATLFNCTPFAQLAKPSLETKPERIFVTSEKMFVGGFLNCGASMYLKVGGVHSPALDIGAEGEGGKVLEGISGHLGKLGHLPTSNLPTFREKCETR